MIYRKLLLSTLIILSALIFTPAASNAQLVYSHLFEFPGLYGPDTPQQQDWLSFRASLPPAGITSITFSGSRNPAGRTCSDPGIAQEIADAMRAGAVGLPENTVTLDRNCDGFRWRVVAGLPVSTNNLELYLSDLISCNSDYALRPGVGGLSGLNANWGGIFSATCGPNDRFAPQTMTVTVNFEAGISLSPLSATNEVFTEHTVTATVVTGGVPLEGTLVDFEVIDGPNTGEASDPDSGECTPNDDCTTDANGEVSWTYSSEELGTDTIIATFGDFESNTVEKTWVVIRNIPTLSEWGLISMAGVLGLVGLIVLRRKKVSA